LPGPYLQYAIVFILIPIAGKLFSAEILVIDLIKISIGKTGSNCASSCSVCAPGASCTKTSFFSRTPECKCQPGHVGKDCRGRCESGRFGFGCKEFCPKGAGENIRKINCCLRTKMEISAFLLRQNKIESDQ